MWSARLRSTCASRMSSTRPISSSPPSSPKPSSTAIDARAGRRQPARLVIDRAGLPVEPDVFEAPAVEHAVPNYGKALDVGLPAGADARVEDDRSRGVASEDPLDLPD